MVKCINPHFEILIQEVNTVAMRTDHAVAGHLVRSWPDEQQLQSVLLPQQNPCD